MALLGVFYPLAAAPTVLRAWRDFLTTAPEELTVDVVLWTVPAEEPFPEAVHGEPYVGVMGVYVGPWEEAEATVRPLRELATPLADISGPIPYRGLQSMLDHHFPEGDRYYWTSLYLDELSDEAIDTVVEHARSRPSPRTTVPIRSRGGAVTRVDGAATAFPNRHSPFLLSVDGTWSDPADDETNVEWVRAFREAVEPYSADQQYLNFSMLETGEAAVRAAYGDNYERLAAVKQRYDPENLFRRNANVRPAT